MYKYFKTDITTKTDIEISLEEILKDLSSLYSRDEIITGLQDRNILQSETAYYMAVMGD